MVRLIGRVPPDAVRPASDSPDGRTANTDTSLEPALTANSQRPSSLRATAPCEPSPAPVPVPPVATLPAALSVPSAARVNTATLFPATWLVRAETARAPSRPSPHSPAYRACR